MSETHDKKTFDNQPSCTSACDNCMFHRVHGTLDGTLATRRSEKLALKELLTDERLIEKVGGNVVEHATKLLESCRHCDVLTGVIKPILRDVQNLLKYSNVDEE